MPEVASSGLADARIRVALVTNIPAPYRIPMWNRICADPRIDLNVIFCAEREPNREWDLEPFLFKATYLRPSFSTKQNRYIHNNLDVVTHLRQLRPDVVITTGFNPTFLYAFSYAQFRSLPHICMTDGTWESEKGLSAVHRIARRLVFRRSAAFIGASDGSRRLFLSYGVPDHKIFTSCLCVDNERFLPAITTVKRHDLMFCGRLAAEKQPLFIVDVAERAASLLNRSVSVLFVGAGPLQDLLRERSARAVGVDASFFGFARQAELPKLYGSSRVFLFPTRLDTWGVVANEACASGLPIVASPFAGGVGEVMKDGVNGFVRDMEIDAWADAVWQLLSSDRLRTSFGERSLELVANYTHEAAAAGFIDAAITAASENGGNR